LGRTIDSSNGWSSQSGDSNRSILHWRSIKGYEIMHMLKKGQIKAVEKGAVRERVKFIAEIFGVAV